MGETRFGDQRLVGLAHHFAGGLRRQHGGERRTVDAGLVGEFRPRRQKQRTAVLDVARDVVEISQRKDVAILITVEDHEIELAQLFREQHGGPF